SGEGSIYTSNSVKLGCTIKCMLNRNNKTDSRQKSPAKRFLSILGLFMFGLYFGLGLVIVFWKDFPIIMDDTYRILFGLVLIIYSFFRFARLWKNRVDEIG